MGLARDLVKGLKAKVLDRYGEKLVSSIADTSSDAPSRFAAPKRDLYDKLAEDGQLSETKQDR